ncbi:TPD1 protein homolog 1B-like [Panicum virgatum]|uniref:Uncharacterized protein n=1 Tax=Panicum virgatum TaxID=38727 RepID=A0A8T0N0L9_PANVG|nr:TPD1 protein homolog 1B-like [Panicum virgatum]KAG2542383.1 hypothetical protein PVAP13_9NG842800 [Panicum virgatum]
MGRFQSAAAVVVVSLLLLFLATADGLGAPARKLQQRQPQDLLHFCEGDVEFIEDDEGPVPGDQSGLRTFQVEIVNKSVPDRVLSNVHVYCAGFDGVDLVVLPPSDFRRISEGECLVNDGGQLIPAQSVMFQYERHSRYPFRVTSAAC